MPSPKTSAKRGSLILELCIALAVYSMIMIGIYGSINILASESGNLQDEREAVYEAERILEYALASPFAMRMSTTTKSIAYPEITDTLSIDFITPCEQEITASASWQNGAAQHARSLSYISTDPDEYASVGNDCHGLPDILPSGSAMPLPSPILNASLSVNTQLVSADMQNGYLYLGSASSTSSVQNPSLYIVDVHNPGKIIQAATLAGTGFRNVDAAGNFVYAAANGTTSQLVVINDADPQNPHIAATSTLPGVVPTGSYPGGTSIYYYDSRIYIGTHRTAGNEFHIFDVGNPAAPAWLGSIELNHNINGIAVENSVAYLGTSGNTKDVIILNVSNPTNIIQISSVAFTGTEDTLSISLLGHYLYVGRAKSTTAGQAEFNVLDISNPSLPILAGSLTVNDSVNAIVVSNNRAYLALANDKLAVVDVSDPTKPILAATIPLADSPQALDFENNILSIVMKKSIALYSL